LAGPETLTTPSTGFGLLMFAPATTTADPPIEAPTTNTFFAPRLRAFLTAAVTSPASRCEFR
jgi:hypothetical protein